MPHAINASVLLDKIYREELTPQELVALSQALAKQYETYAERFASYGQRMNPDYYPALIAAARRLPQGPDLRRAADELVKSETKMFDLLGAWTAQLADEQRARASASERQLLDLAYQLARWCNHPRERFLLDINIAKTISDVQKERRQS